MKYVGKAGRLLRGSVGVLPDVLLIGAARGGTTSLAQYLDAHPRHFGASRKEVQFRPLPQKRAAVVSELFPDHVVQVLSSQDSEALVSGGGSVSRVPCAPTRTRESTRRDTQCRLARSFTKPSGSSVFTLQQAEAAFQASPVSRPKSLRDSLVV